MAGYSGTPLPRKLGFREGMTVALSGLPDNFEATLGELPPGLRLVTDHQPAEIVICCSDSAEDLERRFTMAMGQIPADGAIWVSWPKRASKVPTDITEDRCREMFLVTGMVDVKVCAIDEIWSGLKFVVRKEHRPGWVGLPVGPQ